MDDGGWTGHGVRIATYTLLYNMAIAVVLRESKKKISRTPSSR
jgi:hypothetical protein